MKKKLFLLSSILLVVSTFLWVKDMLEPEWKQYQVEYYEQQRNAVEKKLQSTSDEKTIADLEEKLAKLQRDITAGKKREAAMKKPAAKKKSTAKKKPAARRR